MTILVLGANGLLGSNVLTLAQERGADVFGTYHTTPPDTPASCSQLDICDLDAAAALLDAHEPDVVVNCAAMTDVDSCEASPERAQKVNAEAPGAIAELCASRGISFTHVSTDYVFGGTSETPYTFTASPNPLQTYGETKLAGEQAVRAQHPEPTIARLSFVYGIHGTSGALTGFPAWVRDRLRDRERTPLFTDQWITPTRAGQAAETLLALHDREQRGLYHIACCSCVTPYEFGLQLCDQMGLSSDLITKGSQSDVDRPAQRPAYTCLDVKAVTEALGRAQPTLAEDIAHIESAF